MLEVTDRTRQRIWQEMFDSERYVQYYELLMNRWGKLDKGIRAGMLIGAALSVAVLTEAIPWGWVGLLAGGLLVLTVVASIWDWGAKSAVATAAATECFIVNGEYATLWTRIKDHAISDEDAQAKSDELLRRIALATAKTVGEQPEPEQEGTRHRI